MVDETKKKICSDDFKRIVINYQEIEQPDYAILLNGNWGSGKTHYINKFIDDLQKAYTDYNFVYFSLNGITSIQTAIANIFCNIAIKFDKNSYFFKIVKVLGKVKDSATELIENKKAKAIVSASTTVSSEVFSFVMNLSLKKQKNIKKTILFLDDLERVSENIDITDLLGNLHNLFITNDIKIIYIADEKKVSTIFKNYEEEREKYIRRVFPFSINKKEVFNSFLDKKIFETCDKTQLLDILIDVFYEEQPNLRTVKFACTLFEDLVNKYLNFQNKDNYFKPEELFFSLSAYAKLYMGGNTNKQELLKALAGYGVRSFSKDSESTDKYEQFVDEYANKNSVLYNLESIIDFVYDGLLDENTLMYNMSKNKETESALNLLSKNLTKLETDEVDNYLQQIISDLSNKKYTIRDLDFLKRPFYNLCLQFNKMNEEELETAIINSIFDDNNKPVLQDYYDYHEEYGIEALPSFTETFNKRIKQEFKTYVANQKIDLADTAFKAIEQCTYDTEYFIKRDDLFIFSDIYSSNRLSEILTLKNEKIYFLLKIVRKNILNCGNPDYYYEEVKPYMEFLKLSEEKIEQLNKVQSNKDIMKIKALESLNKTIREAKEYIESYIKNK